MVKTNSRNSQLSASSVVVPAKNEGLIPASLLGLRVKLDLQSISYIFVACLFMLVGVKKFSK